MNGGPPFTSDNAHTAADACDDSWIDRLAAILDSDARRNTPKPQGWLVECWLGHPKAERAYDDAAHSDFWQVSREGFAFLQRGYQEDGPDNLEPGTILDLTLPIWRTAELLLHAANLARALGGNGTVAST